MKRALLSLIVSLAASVFAQDFTFDPEKSYVMDTTANGVVDVKTKVRNETGDMMVAWKWEVVEMENPDGWFDIPICDDSTCYFNVAVGDPKTMKNIPADSNFFFKATFGPNEVIGNGYVKIAFYNPADSKAGSDTVTLGINALTLDVDNSLEESMNDAKVLIYPNPIQDNLMINVDANEQLNISVFNFIGEVIAEQQQQNGWVQIDFTSYPPGTYFVRIASENEVITKKLIKQ